MIIGLTGKKQSGKDTTCQLISDVVADTISVERRAFADKLKQSAAALLDVELWQLVEWKLDDNYRLEGGHFNIFDHDRDVNMTFRTFLQRYGTEAHREVFGDDFWLEQCLPKRDYNGKYLSDSHIIVVTDVRFLNEAAWIRELGGWIWKVRRGAVESGDNHPSEVELEKIIPDVILDNNGTMPQLAELVKENISRYGIELR